MKVRVAVTLDIDEKEWAETYGPNGRVRDDVLSYVNSVLWDVPFVREIKG